MMKKLIFLVLTGLLVACQSAPVGCSNDTLKIKASYDASTKILSVSVPVGYGITADQIVFTDANGEADYSANFAYVSEETDNCQTTFSFENQQAGDRFEVYMHVNYQEGEPWPQIGETVVRQ